MTDTKRTESQLLEENDRLRAELSTLRRADKEPAAPRDIFREERYGALPVLDKHGDLVGIISAHDLLGALDDLLMGKGRR